MVPTEILAQQHMESLQQLFDPNEVTIALLTGSTKAKERRELLEKLGQGEINVVIGTCIDPRWSRISEFRSSYYG